MLFSRDSHSSLPALDDGAFIPTAYFPRCRRRCGGGASANAKPQGSYLQDPTVSLGNRRPGTEAR